MSRFLGLFWLAGSGAVFLLALVFGVVGLGNPDNVPFYQIVPTKPIIAPPMYTPAPTAAVIATKSGEWASDALPSKPFSKGDVFCIEAESITTGQFGNIGTGPGGVYKAPNDGTFAPAPTAGNCGAIPQTVISNVPYHYPQNNPQIIYFCVLGGLLLADVLAFYMWKNRDKHRAARLEAEKAHEANLKLSKKLAEIVPKCKDRWPENRFPRVERGHNLEAWEAMLAEWPTHPATDIQRKENEKLFWEKELPRHTVNINGTPSLVQKQRIIDYYTDQEPWIVRRYFAATGEYIEPHLGPEFMRLTNKWNAALDRTNKLSGVHPDQTARWAEKQRAETDFKTANDKSDEYLSTGKKTHMEKWGGWYFMKIENAFLGHVPADFGPSAATSPVSHPAQDDLGYNPSA